jgi:hypothetical protein
VGKGGWFPFIVVSGAGDSANGFPGTHFFDHQEQPVFVGDDAILHSYQED